MPDDRDQLRYLDAGFIYVVEMEGQGIFKIGRTVNIEKRLSQFGIQPPFRYKLRFAYRVDNHDRVEHYFHVIFKKSRLNGEWFRLNEIQVEAIRAELLRLQCEWLIDRIVEHVKDFSFLMDSERLSRFGFVLAKVFRRQARRSILVDNLRVWCHSDKRDEHCITPEPSIASQPTPESESVN